MTSAQRHRLISYNPATDADLPRVEKEKVEPWEPEELAQFLDAAASHRLGCLFELMAFTGLRRGEALGLRWQDVELARARIVVRRQLVQVGSRAVAGPVKTRSGEQRIVDLGDRAVGVLMAQRIAQDRDRSILGAGYRDEGLVFAAPDGRELSPEFVTKTFTRLVGLSGVRRQRLTCAICRRP
jgi:integrase